MMTTDDIETYLAILGQFALDCVEKRVAPSTLLEGHLETGNVDLERCVHIRDLIATSAERVQASAYLMFGFFNKQSVARRILLFLITFDLECETWQKSIAIRFSGYAPNQPIFARFPHLYGLVRTRSKENGGDLLRANGLGTLGPDGCWKVDSCFLQPEPFLPASLVSWCSSEYGNVPLFVRVDPTYVATEPPARDLTEAIIRPADPKWMRQLSLYHGHKRLAIYALVDHDNPTVENQTEYWEYHIKGIRELVVTATRQHDRISMMLEELTIASGDNGKSLIGRMLHFDANVVPEKSFTDSRLEHADLAVNVYSGTKADERKGWFQSSTYRFPKASFRTHLLRIENVPFGAALGLAELFFESSVLLNEWCDNQFS